MWVRVLALPLHRGEPSLNGRSLWGVTKQNQPREALLVVSVVIFALLFGKVFLFAITFPFMKNNLGTVLVGNVDGVVGGTAVDNYDFVCDFSRLNQSAVQALFFVQGYDVYRQFHKCSSLRVFVFLFISNKAFFC